jgi:hypothetical protein
MMTRNNSILFRSVIGAMARFVFAMLMMTLERSFPEVLELLGSPAFWLFDRWQQLGLPPRGEAALAGPYFAFFIQWVVLGAIIGAFSRRRTSPSPTN